MKCGAGTLSRTKLNEAVIPSRLDLCPLIRKLKPRSMNVNIQNKTISKLQGKRTPATTITFAQLDGFIGIWSNEVGPMLTSATSEIIKWRKAFRPPTQIRDVLHGIIVIFGEGKRFVWPRVNKSLAGDGAIAANTAITSVDNNISTITATNILILFRHLASIKGLGKPSYASKVLRCLSDEHVVLDNMVKDELDEHVYVDFRQKCEDVAKAMCPPRSPAEVEGGLFAWLQILNPKQKKLRWKQFQITKTLSASYKHMAPAPSKMPCRISTSRTSR